MSGRAGSVRAGGVLGEWRDDPDKPDTRLRGLRVRDGVREMHARGRISEAQWLAVEHFRADAERVSGGGLGVARLTPGGSGGCCGEWLPGDAVLAAQARLRRAYAQLGGFRAAAELLLLENLTAAEGARRLRCAKAAIGTALRGALEALTACYGQG